MMHDTNKCCYCKIITSNINSKHFGFAVILNNFNGKLRWFGDSGSHEFENTCFRFSRVLVLVKNTNFVPKMKVLVQVWDTFVHVSNWYLWLGMVSYCIGKMVCTTRWFAFWFAHSKSKMLARTLTHEQVLSRSESKYFRIRANIWENRQNSYWFIQRLCVKTIGYNKRHP